MINVVYHWPVCQQIMHSHVTPHTIIAANSRTRVKPFKVVYVPRMFQDQLIVFIVHKGNTARRDLAVELDFSHIPSMTEPRHCFQ